MTTNGKQKIFAFKDMDSILNRRLGKDSVFLAVIVYRALV